MTDRSHPAGETATATFETKGGARVTRQTRRLRLETAIEPIIDSLDSRPGVLLASSYEYPGRYTRWDVGFVDPPLEITSRDRAFQLRALNERGRVLLPPLAAAVSGLAAVERAELTGDRVEGLIRQPERWFAEEERSRQHSVFSVVRGLLETFHSPEDAHLGLYGAFGYDLAFQFEPVTRRLARPDDRRDLVLFLPDRLTVVDHRLQVALEHSYDFCAAGASTAGLPRSGAAVPYAGGRPVPQPRDHRPGEYAEMVRLAHEWFRRGDLFEVVPGQSFHEPCAVAPSAVFRRLREVNPAPYGSLMNLGAGEYLVGASPEMYVRVGGRRVETCPISGTVARGADVIGDSEQIIELLTSEKQAAELTMCTDVDRNDKSRICEPGSVRLIGRRQIEMYSKVIHTVDHVEGRLREGFDAIDAFLTHTWAVTVTGAPKLWAMRFIEDHEKSPRGWYGGAIGFVGFDGGMNTGLTLRTIRVKDGRAEIRAGSTLLSDSVPEEEERETELKAAALIEAVRGRPEPGPAAVRPEPRRPGEGRRVLLIDHEDSFVHTLANYLRQTGADVRTVRSGRGEPFRHLDGADLVVLSPGPGRPGDFDLPGTVGAALRRDLPVFGVCLGLQGIVEHFGGRLGLLPSPMHGKPSEVRVVGGRLFEGLPGRFVAGRYHSLFAAPETLPEELEVTAVSDDGVIMAVEHRRLPVAAFQFHPESIMTLRDGIGMRLMGNVVRHLVPAGAATAAPPPP